ncbi:MAG: ATP-grasp domain-containing protein, partial [Planctomycetota bacterium]
MAAANSTLGSPSSQALLGKRILVIGVGREEYCERGRDQVRRARDLGVEVVLLGAEDAAAASIAHSVIAVDPADYQSCRAAVQRYLARTPLDGIVTFLEERTEIVARLQRDFGCKGHSVFGSRACRDKNAMRAVLKENHLPVPRFAPLNTRREAEEIASWFPTPAFLKPVEGSGSVATRRVANRDEIVSAFDDVAREIDELVPPQFVECVLKSFSAAHANLLLEEYLAPAERLERQGLGRVGIELLVQDGKISFFAMADGRCFSPADHRYATLSFPSRLEESDERQFRSLADDVVSVFGLSHGAVVLDAVMTDGGPQLYEINARIDGSIILPLVERCYGVDLVEQSLRIAVGLPLDLRAAEKPGASALLHLFLASTTSRISSLEFPDVQSCDDCTAEFYKQEGEIVLGREAPYDAIATVMLAGSNRD